VRFSSLAAELYPFPRMHHLTRALIAFFWHLGGPGLLLLGILDSSFLFAPLGNDLLVVAMTAHYHSVSRMLYYAAMSTIGSVLGCLLVDVTLRSAGEHGLARYLPARRIGYIKGKVERNAAWALIVASIAPPPFPFTPFIMAAAALQYPRKKMLAITGAARMVRFTAIGALALIFGRRILRWAQSDVVQAILIGLIVLCIVGSVISVVSWIRRSRRPAPVR
jgi:membrane protein YqaA with SNARE-associated domain